MKDAVRNAAPDFTDRFEGKLPYMYTDVIGLVTTARGNLIDFGRARAHPNDPIVGTTSDAAAALPWTQYGAPADKALVHDQFWAVKNAWPKIQSVACVRLTTVRLSDRAVDDLFYSKLDEMWAYLLGQFPHAESWCADAQLGLFSMAWALGPAFSGMFPTFTKAANTGDWDVCAGPPGDPNTTLTARGQAWMRDGSPGTLAANLNPGLRARNIATKKLFANAQNPPDPEQLT
jgi:GH24 family phage-related lysozyme (muramidase)